MNTTTNANIRIRRANERGHANHGWLETYHSFSFAHYHDPKWMGFRSLRVINDDIVMPGQGFGRHPHDNMEIVTYILSGQLEHKDSMGNGHIIKTGEVQYMAAGTGVFHSEFNPSDDEAAHLLQIWIQPDERNVTPRYAEKSYADAPNGQWNLVTSKQGRDGSIAIHQDADLWLARLGATDQLAFDVKPERHVWLHLAEGSLTLNGQRLESGDAAYVSEATTLELEATSDSQVLLFDLS
ncbi:pirin family protein [Pelagicoccus sp. SDUM812003]|uniref:pirin family protein n=1 Tax=Pelagicoccus sp. SDUM812003 TaxID=3041267 RepID=UPI00280CA08C|nr:pirin family protein [Pelagicoccus sp. SDUM812003]MDQ8203407.1 pirin family protein [Pelagicoccus sp. SDUM812003]